MSNRALLLSALSLLPLAAIIACLGGCASWQPVSYRYPRLGLTLVCADENAIDVECRRGGNLHTDTGVMYPTDHSYRDLASGTLHVDVVQVPACFKTAGREIWMKWGEWCDTMAHELCHAEGLPPAVCEREYPRR